jgi:hypothetical protein
MISLTPAEERLRDFLASLAAKADPARPTASTITYKELAAELDPDGHIGWKRSHPRYGSLKTALYHVSTYEVEHGRPMITGFVVRGSQPGKGFPGSGFFLLARRLDRLAGDSEEAKYAFWQSEMKACVQHWSAAGAEVADAGLPEAQFDAIMAELSKIKQMLRQLLHG